MMTYPTLAVYLCVVGLKCCFYTERLTTTTTLTIHSLFQLGTYYRTSTTTTTAPKATLSQLLDGIMLLREAEYALLFVCNMGEYNSVNGSIHCFVGINQESNDQLS